MRHWDLVVTFKFPRVANGIYENVGEVTDIICCALLLQFCFLLQIAIPFHSYLTEELCSKVYTIKLYIVVSQHLPQSLSFSLSCPTSSYFLANPLSIFSISLSPLKNKTWETQNWYKYISILTQIFCYAFFALIFQFSGICSLHAFILSHRSLLMFLFGFYIVISFNIIMKCLEKPVLFFLFFGPYFIDLYWKFANFCAEFVLFANRVTTICIKRFEFHLWHVTKGEKDKFVDVLSLFEYFVDLDIHG